MKTKYKHIHFEDESYMYPERKTQVWVCKIVRMSLLDISNGLTNGDNIVSLAKTRQSLLLVA